MKLAELVQQTGTLPNTFEINGGKFELFQRKRTGNKGYIVTYWQIVNGVQEHIFLYGEGSTLDLAKEDLKNKILKQ